MERNEMKLAETEIRAHYAAAGQAVREFEHAPRIAKADAPVTAERSPGIAGRRAFRSTTPGLVTRMPVRAGGVRLMDRIATIASDDEIPSPAGATAITALRRAVAVAMAVSKSIEGLCALGELRQASLQGTLSDARRPEYVELLGMQALASLSVMATVLSHHVSRATAADETPAELGELQEILAEGASVARDGALWELDRALAAHAHNESRILPVMRAFAERLSEAVAARAAQQPRMEVFTSASWRIEADDLAIAGIGLGSRAREAALTMTFKKPEEVVGNHIAKAQSMRLARMLMAYDFDTKMNPFVDLGGFIFTFMGDGAPGTGKTTLIQMMAGLVQDYCSVAGRTFRYRNLSMDSIDSYQGKSGQNAKAFIDAVLDPNAIGFGTIDDIDQIAGKRGDRQSSAGQQEVTAILMEAFAGAGTVVRGNCTFGMFSNFPENVDDALRQRAGARFLVDGPQSREDYIDILSLLLGKRHQIPLGDHDLFAAQAIQRAVRESYAGHAEPKEPGLKAVWDRLISEAGRPETIAQMGAYLKAIQEADSRFTGRAIKNITDAVKVRAMDFDMPDEWMERPELFLDQPYATKKAMIEELRQPITVDMVIQEINRYADSEFRYADKSDEAAISGMVRDMQRTQIARERFVGQPG